MKYVKTALELKWLKTPALEDNLIDSCRHRVGSRDEMRWSPYIEGQWIARMPADHVCRTIIEVEEIKRNEWVWRKNGGVKFMAGKNGRNPEKKPTQSPFRWPRNSHGVTETRTRDPSAAVDNAETLCRPCFSLTSTFVSFVSAVPPISYPRSLATMRRSKF